MDEHVTLLEDSGIKKEVGDALPGESEELFEVSNFCLSPKHEGFPDILGSYKLETDNQELEPTCFNNEKAEDASSIDYEARRDTCSSILSPEHQKRPVGISSRVSNLASGPQELHRNDKGMIISTVYNSDSASQPILSGPEPILVVKKLTEKVIEELTAGIWRCDSCGKVKKSFLMLDLHIDTDCEKLSPIECDVCPAVIRSYRDFVAHFLEHKMGETKRCPICLQECNGDMRTHLVLQGHFQSSVSELNLQKNASLVLSHNLSGIDCLSPLELKLEQEAFIDQETFLDSRLHSIQNIKLGRHKEINREKKKDKCNICKKCFSTSSYLNNHQRLHTGENPFKCDLCKKCFSRSSNLNVHQRMHTGEKPFKCHQCMKCFSRSSNLNVHQRMHTGEKPFECHQCKKSFSTSSHLNIHQKVHTGDKPFKCQQCKKCFSQSSHLNKHQTVHTGDKPFTCHQCKKSFSTSSHLNIHQRVHTGDRPFKCDLCKKCFSTSSYLNIHQRVHTGDKPFKCDLCKKCFSRSSNLNVHQRVHTGDKPFKCDLCKKCFSQSSSLNLHQRMHCCKTI